MATINGKPLGSLRVVDLKVELEKRGLPKSGTKKDLVERLENFILRCEDPPADGGSRSDEVLHSRSNPVRSPPNVAISQNVSDNDIVREYLKMRQDQYANAMSESDQDEQDRQQQQLLQQQARVEQQEELERRRQVKEQEELEKQRLIKQQEELERQKLIKEREELEKQQQIKELEELERQKRIKEQEELEKHKQMERQKELERQRKEQAELERLRQVKEQEELERQRQVKEQEELKRQQKVKEREELERQRHVKEQEEKEKQRHVEQLKELERQQHVKEQQEMEKQRKLEEQKELERQRQIKEEEELEKQRKLEQQKELEKQRQVKEREELEKQLQVKEREELEKQRQSREQKVSEKLQKAKEQEEWDKQQKVNEVVVLEKQGKAKEQEGSDKQHQIKERKESEKQRRTKEQEELERQRQTNEKKNEEKLKKPEDAKLQNTASKRSREVNESAKEAPEKPKEVDALKQDGKGGSSSREQIEAASAEKFASEEGQECDEIVVSGSPMFEKAEDDEEENEQDRRKSNKSAGSLGVENPKADHVDGNTKASEKSANSKGAGGDKETDENQVPPLDTAFRTLSRTLSSGSRRDLQDNGSHHKRRWRQIQKSSVSSPTGDAAEGPTIGGVSATMLKDIIPDIKPDLEDMDTSDVDDSTADSDQVEHHPDRSEPASSKRSPKNQGRSEEPIQVEMEGPAPKSAEAPATDTKEYRVALPLKKDQERVSPKVGPDSSDSSAPSQQQNVVSVKNLVRPFALTQLKELLSRTGKIGDGEDSFWIDKIKSHAIVRYSSAAEAEETVAALDGVKWPTTNPKTLSVTLVDPDMMVQAKEGRLQEPSSKPKEEQATTKASTARDKKRKRSPSPNSHQDAEEASKNIKAEKRPRKGLDDLFNKTKALPCVYWKPLYPLPTDN